MLLVADGGHNLIQSFGISEINITNNLNSIATNSNFDFGNVSMLSNKEETFVIQSLGTAPLIFIGEPTVWLDGTNASDFTVTALSNAALAPGATVEIKIKFTPSGNGARTARIRIPNTDPDEDFYTINLIGTGVKSNQTITFAALPSKLIGDVAFTLNATSSSALAVSYTSSNTSVATVSGNTVAIVGAGSTTITASQAGDANYNAATNVTQTLTVNKANQSITFNALPTKTVGDASFNLTATASSSLAVSFTTTSDKITISSSQVTLVKAGRATITASQAGDATFNAAASVDQSFCIKPAKPTITVSGANTEAITLTSSSATGNQWFKDGTAITGATNATLSVTAVGVYKVQVKVDDCLSEFSADTPFIITGDISVQSNGITIYPNPVEDYLEVRGLKGEINTSQLSDMTGRTNTLTLEQRSTVHRANVQHLSQGVYLLRVQQGNSIYQIKFIKK